MATLTIAWQYLTGHAVATDTARRERAEWPPHPARVFMALAAAWFETEPPDDDPDARTGWDAEGSALRWLETLGDPEMILPVVDPSSERTDVTFYVPVNDDALPSSATLQSCPAFARSKQPRSFPRTWVGNEPVLMHWPEAQHGEPHREALDRLCRKVTRIGHASSLVAMRVLPDGAESADGERTHLVVDDLLGTERMRSVSSGTLEMLAENYGGEARRRHAELNAEIQSLRDKKKQLRGKAAAEAKAAIDARIRECQVQLETLIPRPPVRPTIGRGTGYRRAGTPAPRAPRQSHFDQDILVLTQIGGPALPATAALAVTKALRDTILSVGPQPAPGWVSGHAPDGQPLQADGGHLAIIPLPFIGHEHADGHLMGLGLVFPRSVPPRERGRVFGPLLVDERRASKEITLRLGPLGLWVLRKREWDEDRRTLDPDQWTAARSDRGGPPGARVWASVTPVVLDRFPRADRMDPAQRLAWEEEVASVIRASCVRIGLPEPVEVGIGTTSRHLGSPRAIGKRRLLRGQPDAPADTDAALGDGFPPYPARGTNAPRPQVHVGLRFAELVIGPVLIGAGRYLGYGLCRPLTRKDF